MPLRRLLLAVVLVVSALGGGLQPDAAAADSSTPDPDHPFSDPTWFPLRDAALVSCVKTNCDGPYHDFEAIDLVGELGDPIYAAGAGIFHIGDIDPSCPADTTTSGTWVWIDHGPEGRSRYSHLDEIVAQEGQLVTPGTIIGRMGHSGLQAPCPTNYLHFERRAESSPSTRLPLTSLRACVNGASVQLPEAMGFAIWDDIPYKQVWTPDTDNSCHPSSWSATPDQPAGSAEAGVEEITVTPSARPGGVEAVRVRLELYHPSLGRYGTSWNHTISPSESSTTFTDLIGGRTYRALVSFRNAAGWSAWSEPTVAVPGVSPVPPPFRLIDSSLHTVGYGWYRAPNLDATYTAAIRRANGSTWGPWTYHEVPPPAVFYRFQDLERGTKYQVTVRAHNEFGTSDWAPRQVITTEGCESDCASGPDVFSPLEPARFADSRDMPTIDGNFRATGRRAAGTAWEIPIAGRNGVPANAEAAVVNLTVLNAAGPGFATVYPCGEVPTASSVNYGSGSVEPNEVIAKLSPAGAICVYTLTTADVIVDVVGHVTDSPYRPLEPRRFADSRDEPTFDGTNRNTGRRRAGTTWKIPIAGRGDVPASAKTAAVNVTVSGGVGPGFATVYPCGEIPNASSLNYDVGITRPNELVAKLSSDGSICVFTLTDVDVIVDVVGYAGDVVGFTPLVPTRIADSRAEPTVDGEFRATGRRAAGSTWKIQIDGRDALRNLEAVIANVTVTDALGPGFVTIFGCGNVPTASSLNYFVGTTRSNETVARLSADGELCVYTSAPAHIIVDVVGFTDG